MLRFAALILTLPALAIAAPATHCIVAGNTGDQARLASDSSARATLCWGGDCLAFAPNAKPVATKAIAAPQFVPEAEVRDDHGHLAVCAGGTCTALGAKLVAAIAAARADNDCVKCDPRPGPIILEATRDRAVVVIANSRAQPVWNVALDKPIDFAKSHGRFGSASVAGNDLIVSWFVTNDAEKITLADAKGRELDGLHDDFSTVTKISGERYVTSGGEAGAFQLIDHGKVVSQLAFPWKYPFYQQITQLDDDHLALVWGRGDAYHLALIAVGKKALTSVELDHFPVCSP